MTYDQTVALVTIPFMALAIIAAMLVLDRIGIYKQREKDREQVHRRAGREPSP